MEVSREKYNILANLYHNVKSNASFSSERKLLKAAREFKKDITLKDVKTFLQTQKAHTRHGNVPHTYRKRIVIINAPGKLLSSDLADMSNIKDYNEGYRYLAFFIDCFSRKLDIIALKNKLGVTMAKALDEHLRGSGQNYTHLWVDLGTEYYNSHVKKICSKHNVTMYSVHNNRVKAAYAERAIRSIKSKLYKIFTHFNTYNYTRYLKDVLDAYNNGPHKGLMGMTPNYVHGITDKKLLAELTEKMTRQKITNYGSINRRRWQLDLSHRDVLAEGTHVRLLTNKAEQIFNKSYEAIYTQEVFIVDSIRKEGGVIAYSLKDLQGEPILGIAYRNELKQASLPTHYEIEKVIRRKLCKKTNKQLALVKYMGYSDKFNQWIPAENVVGI